MNYHGALGKYQYATPPWLIDEVREFMGGIELDPFSSKEFNLALTKADRFYDGDNADGFTAEWKAKTVFVNPPGGAKRGTQAAFLKMQNEFANGSFTTGIFLAFSIDALSTTDMLEYPTCVFKKRFGYMISRAEVKRRRENANSIGTIDKYQNMLQNSSRFMLDPTPPRPSCMCLMTDSLELEASWDQFCTTLEVPAVTC